MTRRAKTVIGKGEREQSRLMVGAAESGTAARQRATEGVTRQQNVGFQQGMQIARLGAETAQRFEEREQRKELTEAQTEQQRKIATGQQMLQQRGQEFREGQAGMERVPGGEQPPLIQDERQRRLQEEMGRGTAGAESPPQQDPSFIGPPEQPETSQRTPEEVARLQQQGQQPIEIGGQAPAAPGLQEPERPGALRLSEVGRRRERRADYEAETRRLAAQSRLTGRQNRVLQAEFAGNKAARKLIRTEMISELDQQKDLFTRVRNMKPSATDWKTLTKWAQEMGMADAPDGGQLMDILKAGGFGPVDQEGQARLQGFVQSYMDRSGMMFTATFGEVPGDFVNFSGPMMAQYMTAQQQITGLMQTLGPQFQNYMGINTLDDKLRFQNRWSAFQVLSGKAGGLPAPGGPTGGMPPGGGGQPPAAPGGAAPLGPPQEVSPGTLEQQQVEQQEYAARGGVGGLVAPANRPGLPLAAPGRVHGRQYEYPRPGEKGQAGPQRSRSERVHGERRQAKVRELQEGGHEQAARDLAAADTPRKVIGETENGDPALNTIPVRSNPDDWTWTEYESGKFGWVKISSR